MKRTTYAGLVDEKYLDQDVVPPRAGFKNAVI